MLSNFPTPSGHTLKTNTQSITQAATINARSSSAIPKNHFTGANAAPKIPRSWNEAFLEANALPLDRHCSRWPAQNASHGFELATDRRETFWHHGVVPSVWQRHADFVKLAAVNQRKR